MHDRFAWCLAAFAGRSPRAALVRHAGRRPSFDLARLVVLLSACLGLACCAPAVSITPQNARAQAEVFMDGRAVLSRNDPFTLLYPQQRNRLRQLWETKNWTELSKEIMESDFDIDIAWFYLGEAALGLNLRPAAAVYYQRALADYRAGFQRSCVKLDREPLSNAPNAAISFGICSGFRFPRDIVNGLIRTRRGQNPTDPGL